MGPGDRRPFTASEEGPYNHQRVPVVQQQHRPGESCSLGLSHWVSFLTVRKSCLFVCRAERRGRQPHCIRITAFKSI